MKRKDFPESSYGKRNLGETSQVIQMLSPRRWYDGISRIASR
jgi:hypothetical protein